MPPVGIRPPRSVPRRVASHAANPGSAGGSAAPRAGRGCKDALRPRSVAAKSRQAPTTGPPRRARVGAPWDRKTAGSLAMVQLLMASTGMVIFTSSPRRGRYLVMPKSERLTVVVAVLG